MSDEEKPVKGVGETSLPPFEEEEAVEPAEASEIEDKIISDEVQETEERLEESGILNADLISEIKKMVTVEIMAELKEDNVLKEKELELSRELEDLEYQKYVDVMMKSDEPWVDFVGNVRDTTEGQRLQMNWNNAFIDFLREIGITGADDEQVVQKYITALLYDMSERNSEQKENGEYA